MRLKYKILLNIIFVIILLASANVFCVYSVLENVQKERLQTREVLFPKSLAGHFFRDIAEQNTSKLTAILSDEKKLRGDKIEYILIFDKKGYLLAHTYLGAISNQLLKLRNDFDKEEQYRIERIDSEGIFVYDIGVPVMEGIKQVGTIHVGVKGNYIQNFIKTLFTPSLIVTVIGVIIATLLAWIMSKSIVKPINELNSAAEKVGEGDLNINLKIKARDEIGNLRIAFNKMTESLRFYREKLILSKNHVDSIISNMADTLIVIALDGKIKTVNKITCELLGYKEDELIGEDAGVIIFSNLEVQLDNVIEDIKEAAFLMTRDFRISHMNKTFISLRGGDKEDIGGRYCYEVIHGREDICQPPRDKCPAIEAAKNKEPFIETHTHFDKQGNSNFYKVIASPILDKQGEVVNYLHLFYEVEKDDSILQTDARRNEIIHKAKEYASRITKQIQEKYLLGEIGLDTLIELGAVKNVDVLYRTKNGEKIPFSLSGSVIRDNFGNIEGVLIVGRDTRLIVKLIANLRNTKVELEEFSKTLENKVRERTKDLTESQEAAFNIMEDLQEAYEQIDQTQKQLIQVEKMQVVGHLASGVAHEVKNPLGIILQGTEYLENLISSEQEEARKTLGVIKNSTKRADNIISSLFDFTRATKSDLQLEDINSILEASLILIQHRLKFEHVEVIEELKQNLPKVLADKNKMQQVFINLLLNAIQAISGKGEVFIRSYNQRLTNPEYYKDITNTQEFKLDGEIVIVEIEDTGVGISGENIKQIFNPFFTTKGPQKGTGLGLSVCLNIINSHKALIKIESQVDKGSKFSVIFKAYSKS